MPRPRSKGLIARMRLRHKLAVSLSIAALLPVLAVSWVAVSVVLDNLDQGLRDETGRQLQVGVTLVVRMVERIGADTVRLAGSGDLAAALADEPVADPVAHKKERVRQVLDRMSAQLPSALVQVFDASGRQISVVDTSGNQNSMSDGAPSRFLLRVDTDSRPVRDALAYKSPLTIDAVTINAEKGVLVVLVVRAAAPVLDSSYRLRGLVILSVPLDGPFTDGLKGALGTDVLIFAGTGEAVGPALSTFIDATGTRAQAIHVNPGIARRVGAGETVLVYERLLGREYAVGYASLINLQRTPIGIFAVAVDRAQVIMTKRVATRSLILGAAGAFAFALLLASVISRQLTRPLGRLHRGAVAVARGDLDYKIAVSEGDELGDLATAFSHMTRTLKENQERLRARMREIMALHGAARTVSSVIDLDEVLREIVDSVAHVFDVRLCALWVVKAPDPGGSGDKPVELKLGAARAKPMNAEATLHGTEGADAAEPLRPMAVEVARTRATVRVDDAPSHAQWSRAALAAGVSGSLLATPLERKGHVIGILVAGREHDAKPFSEADADLLATFADQAASAVENARLYEEVRALNEELEGKVRRRTAELTHMNAELGRTIRELRETQAQLILSERLAGLGLLVAGVAHEINSPSAAIAGSVGALADNIAQLVEHTHRLSKLDLDPHERRSYVDFVSEAGPLLAARHMSSAVLVRRATRAFQERLQSAGIPAESARTAARELAEIGVDDELLARFLALITHPSSGHATERALALASYLTEHVFLHRNTVTIRHAIRRIQRIVGALKTYSHLDQQASFVEADVHEGIEDTLVILDYVLRDIYVERKYGQLPRVPVYVDELNQVWTNLIQNAVQALEGKGQITIETRVADQGVAVCIIDAGPGIPEDVLPHIFEPFYTTKPKGEGTGLGLGIVRQIIKKHHGNVTCESRPGRTCFCVWLPASQPTEDSSSNAIGLPGPRTENGREPSKSH